MTRRNSWPWAGAALALFSGALFLAGCSGNASLSPAQVATGNGGHQLSYLGAPSIAIPGSPLVPAVADLDGDGLLDLVTSTGSGDGGPNRVRAGAEDVLPGVLVVSRATAPGVFEIVQELPTGDSLGQVCLGDLDGDGDADAAVTDMDAGDVKVALNEAGTLGEPAAYPVASDGPLGLLALDLDHDGDLDLVTANGWSSGISVLPGNGDGTFGEAATYATDQGLPSLLASADFNEDGHADVAVSDEDGPSVVVLFGNGDGTFEQAPTRLAMARRGPSRRTAFLNSRTDVEVDEATIGVVAADLDGDGHADLAATCPNTDEVVRVLGDGTGSFGEVAAFPLDTYYPTMLVAADLTGDGVLDLATPGQGSSEVSVLTGTGTGDFLPGRDYGAGSEPLWAVAGDVDADGFQDLLVSNRRWSNLTWLRGSGNGTLIDTPRLQDPDFGYSEDVAVGDFDMDGHPDLVSSQAGGETVIVYRNLGNGIFAEGTSYPCGNSPVAVETGDFNEDGAPDIAVVNQTQTTDGVDPGMTSGHVLLNDGTGAFSAPQPLETGGVPTDLAVLDWTGDGHLDLATCLSQDQAVAVLPGQGDGTFGPPTLLPTGQDPRRVTVADFDGDGRPDLATLNCGDGTASVLLAKGGSTSVALAGGWEPQGLAGVDRDGDGLVDLAVVGWGEPGERKAALDTPSGVLSLFMNNGDGTFDVGMTVQVGVLPSDVAAADLDLDGRQDLVVSDVGASSVLLLNAVRAPVEAYNMGPAPVRVVTEDLNGDGYPDVAAYTSFWLANERVARREDCRCFGSGLAVLNSLLR